MDSFECNQTGLRVNCGIDLEDLRRWRRPLGLLKQPARIFSAEEIEWCQKQRDPIPHFAARWCAREAVIKALSPLVALRITDVQTQRDQYGGLTPLLSNGRRWPAALVDISLSISHSQTTVGAVATVLYQETEIK